MYAVEPLPALRELPVLVLDCQSTGATPAHGSLLEVGWALGEGPATSLKVALPDGAVIPRHVARITGLGHEAMRDATPPAEVWRAIAGAAQTSHVAVIHFASFERRFLEALHAEHGEGEFPLELVCTHEIAQRLFPDLPRRGLRPLAGYLGEPAGDLRRAADHVRATQRVWRCLVDRLEAAGIRTIDDVRAFVRASPRARPLARGWPMPKEVRASLPLGPGVYRMRRIDGSLLYVGKATSLKRRVAQHFTRRRGMPERALEMLTQAQKLDVTTTETALEAALLEHDEIKAHDPPYNVALRADRTRIAFASFDLRSIAPRSDARHVLGPIRDPRRVEGIVALVHALAGEEIDPALALGLLPEWAPEPELFGRGVALFGARHGLARPSLREVLALGARIDVDDEEADEEIEGWSEERVAEAVADRLAIAARALARARFLALLSESSVSFAMGDARRVLVVSRGQIVRRAWQPRDALPPTPPGFLRRASERRALDLSGYDRLRVLTTELRGVSEAVVRLGPSAIVQGDALARVLARV